METSKFVIRLFFVEAKLEKTYITSAISKEKMEEIVGNLTNPVEDVVVPLKSVLVGQEQHEVDKVILNKALLETPILIETGVKESL